MVYVVKFRPAKDPNSKLTRTVFAECKQEPSRERAVKLLNEVTGGDFQEDTIRIQKLQNFDSAEVRSHGGTIFSL